MNATALWLTPLLINLPATILVAVIAVRRKFAWAWPWVLLTIFLPPVAIVAMQHRQLAAPRWYGWVTRLVIGVAASCGLIAVSSSALLTSPSVLAVKGHLLSLLTQEPLLVEGDKLTIGNESTEMNSFSNGAFVCASICLWWALFHFESVIEKLLSFALVAFVVSLAIDCFHVAKVLDAYAATGVVRIHWPDVYLYSLTLPMIAMFWLSLAWAFIEAGHRRHSEEVTPA